jgi:hypothetical protein
MSQPKPKKHCEICPDCKSTNTATKDVGGYAYGVLETSCKDCGKNNLRLDY